MKERGVHKLFVEVQVNGVGNLFLNGFRTHAGPSGLRRKAGKSICRDGAT